MRMTRTKVRGSIVVVRLRVWEGRQENSLRTVCWISEALYTKYRWSMHTPLGPVILQKMGEIIPYMGNRSQVKSYQVRDTVPQKTSQVF